MSKAEPELGAPGKSVRTWIERGDGSGSFYSLPQTKWDNCEHLMSELRGYVPTDDQLAAWQLTRAEYEHFLERCPRPRDDRDQ